MLTLKTSTLPEVANGLLAAAIDHQLSQVQSDITDRPNVRAKRKVVIELLLSPADSGEDIVDAVDVQFTVDSKFPKTTMKRRMASFKKTKSLGFETDTNRVTHAPNQRTFTVTESDEEEDSAGE